MWKVATFGRDHHKLLLRKKAAECWRSRIDSRPRFGPEVPEVLLQEELQPPKNNVEDPNSYVLYFWTVAGAALGADLVTVWHPHSSVCNQYTVQGAALLSGEKRTCP